MYRPLRRIAQKTLYSSPETETTIVCSTCTRSPNLKRAILSWLANEPKHVIVVADPRSYGYVRDLLHPLLRSTLEVIMAPVTNKRAQLSLGFSLCKTPFIVIADDDTSWSSCLLPSLISPFQGNARLGGVFPEVQIIPQKSNRTIWEEIAIIRLFGDAIDGRTSNTIDGGVFCASGPTAAYRASILQDHTFQHSFQNEAWRGATLNAGDDQSLTRWLCKHGWEVLIAPYDDWGGRSGSYGHVDTHVRSSWRHLLQLLRWSRSDWQANFMALFVERHIWRSVPIHNISDDRIDLYLL